MKKLLRHLLPAHANLAASQDFGVILYSRAKQIPSPEGDLLRIFAPISSLILEELLFPDDKNRKFIEERLPLLHEQAIADLYYHTVWSLMSMFLAQEKEGKDDWIVACSDLLNDPTQGAGYLDLIWDRFDNFYPHIVMKRLHESYRRVLGLEPKFEGGFFILEMYFMSGYKNAMESYYAEK